MSCEDDGPDLGRGRPAHARLSHRRHVRPHHAGRRRPAAPGRLQPHHGRGRAQLPRLRSGLRLRSRGHRRVRHAPHGMGASLQPNGGYLLRVAAGADDAQTLPSVTVTGDGAETAWGPVAGFVAKRSATATKTDTPLHETPQSVSCSTKLSYFPLYAPSRSRTYNLLIRSQTLYPIALWVLI